VAGPDWKLVVDVDPSVRTSRKDDREATSVAASASVSMIFRPMVIAMLCTGLGMGVMDSDETDGAKPGSDGERCRPTDERRALNSRLSAAAVVDEATALWVRDILVDDVGEEVELAVSD